MKPTQRHCRPISSGGEKPAEAQASALEIKLNLITDLFQVVIDTQRAIPFFKA